MKKILAAVVVSLCMAAGVSFAQEAKIGYIDVKKALMECKAGKAAKVELDKLMKAKQPALEAERQKLEAMQADYDKNVSDMSDKEKQAKQKEFQEKYQVYQKLLSEAQKEVNAKDSELSKNILADINKATEEIAKAGKYAVIFNKTEGLMVYTKSGLDVTDKVIKKLNAK